MGYVTLQRAQWGTEVIYCKIYGVCPFHLREYNQQKHKAHTIPLFCLFCTIEYTEETHFHGSVIVIYHGFAVNSHAAYKAETKHVENKRTFVIMKKTRVHNWNYPDFHLILWRQRNRVFPVILNLRQVNTQSKSRQQFFLGAAAPCL